MIFFIGVLSHNKYIYEKLTKSVSNTYISTFILPTDLDPHLFFLLDPITDSNAKHLFKL